MPRLPQLSRRKTAVATLALAVGVASWLAYSQWTHSQEVRPAPQIPAKSVLDNLPKVSAADLIDPNHGYNIQDGTLVSGQGATAPAAPGTPGDVNKLDMDRLYAEAKRLAEFADKSIYKDTLTPHWLPNDSHFWYRNDLRGGTREFILVDAAKGQRAPAFDHSRLAAALSTASNTSVSGDKLPFDYIAFTEGLKGLRFKANGVAWHCDLTDYTCIPAEASREVELVAHDMPVVVPRNSESADNLNTPPGEIADDPPFDEDQDPQQKKDLKKDQKKGGGGGGKGGGKGGGAAQAKSPNGDWTAVVKDSNVYVTGKDGQEKQLTKDGVAGKAYGSLSWASDSKTLVFYKITPGSGADEIYLIETSPKGQLPAKLSTRKYARATDTSTTYEMWLASPEQATAYKVAIEPIDYKGIPQLKWKGGTHFTFEKYDRGHQRYQMVEVEASTGKLRHIIDDKTDSFIWINHAPKDKLMGISINHMKNGEEIVLVSTRDGWKHFYLVEIKTGKITQITKGEWPVRSLDKIDQDKRQIFFQASGRNAGEDPYLKHSYRINFDGTGLTELTKGNGDHTVQYSPGGRYIIDHYSRVDLPPVHELRQADDGELVCDLEKADVTDLEQAGIKSPEQFVAKGRDGKTDIWGIVHRPQNFDPKKKYPVIEQIYAGPHDFHVPHNFGAKGSVNPLAALGYIVVQIDGMGTHGRSQAFHAMCWKNVADAGFPDRILWMKALAAKYNYVDITRVGIFGTSAGGQNALGALLFHPEFYKVAFSACGCHDNRLDKASWNEQWMGLLGKHYEENSNFVNAHKLQGRLLLVVGEMDTNVPPESTYRVVDALIKANKDFDFIAVPGAGHSSGGAFGTRRRNDLFAQYLQGQMPPDRNAGGGGGGGKGKKKGDEE